MGKGDSAERNMLDNVSFHLYDYNIHKSGVDAMYSALLSFGITKLLFCTQFLNI